MGNIRLLTGTHESLIRLHMRSHISAAVKDGKTVLVDPEEIQGQSAFFEDTDPCLYVFTDVGQFTESFWKGIRDLPDDFLLVSFDTLKKTHPWNAIPRLKPEVMEAPKPYEAETKAVEFVKMLMKANQRILPENFAHVIVAHAGTDFGVLAFEVWKLMLLVPAGQSVASADIRAAVASFQSPDGDKLISAIVVGDVGDVVRIMDRMESHSDPTMAVTLSTLQPVILRWYVCLYTPRDQIATALGMNPWLVENKILPLATKVGRKKLRALVDAVAAAHEAVSSGSLSPWAILKIGILKALSVQ